MCVLGLSIDYVCFQLTADIGQKVFFDPPLRQLVVEGTEVNVGAAAAVAQILFVSVPWV